MWSQVVGATWGTFSQLSMESMSMPRKEFVQELCSAVHDRDHEAFLSTLGSKPELALYQRIYEGPGLIGLSGFCTTAVTKHPFRLGVGTGACGVRW